MRVTDLATSGAGEGRTFFMTACIQFLRIPAVMADRVCTPSRVWGGEGRAQTGWPQQNPKRQGFTFHSQKVSYVYLKTIVSLSLVFGDVVAGSQLDLPIQVWSLWEDNGVSLKCFTSPMSEVCGSPPKVGHVERNAADLRSAMSFSPLQRSSPCSSAGCGLSTRTNISGTGKREASQPEFKVRAL